MAIKTGLEVAQLGCIRQKKPLFQSLSFQVDAGEVFLIEGRNGSGKSSLLHLLAGLSTPHAGSITWNGEKIDKTPEEYQQNLHYIGHQNGLKLGLTVAENIQLAAHLALHTLSPHTRTILTDLDLYAEKDTFAHSLSAGQKRRIALAKLFLIPKPLWILDEPFTALDENCQQLFLQYLATHVSTGGICLLSSHHAIDFRTITAKQLRLSPC